MILSRAKIRARIGTLYIAIFYYRFPQFHGILNKWKFNLIYSNFILGKKSNIWGKFYIVMYDPKNSRITIGDNLWMVSDEKRTGITLFSRCKLTTINKGQIKIGNNVALNGTIITSKKNIEIGNGSMIAPNVIIVDSDFHAIWPPEERHKQASDDEDEPVIIGKNVWIGMNSIVLKGVTIGDNSLIGAGSIVNKSIPANSFAAGSPARIIKTFNDK